MKIVDLTGQKFNRWTVISRAENASNGGTKWNCLCECGNTGCVRRDQLLNGRSSSCGCYCIEKATTHGDWAKNKGKGTYASWQAMRDRCDGIDTKKFVNYTDRGITICDRWKNSFANFLEDMGERPEGKTIDRINNLGNYEPSNCHWATTIEQGINKRNNVLITHNGETHPISEWSRITGINYRTLYDRVRRGLSGDVLFKKVRHYSCEISNVG